MSMGNNTNTALMDCQGK